jgi:hypothetical protein
MSSLELWVGIASQRLNMKPQHWALLLKTPNEDQASWYHVVGESDDLRFAIHRGKRFQSRGLCEYIFICLVSKANLHHFETACDQATVTMCQEWATAVLGDLETRGLVPRGTHAYWYNRVDCDN